MRLSNDLLVYDNVDTNHYSVYNKFTHSLSVIHKAIYKYLEESQKRSDFANIHDDLSKDQVRTLLDFSVLIDDEKSYLAKKAFSSRDTSFKELHEAYLHLTMDCNLACDYCYHRDNINQKKSTLPVEKWFEVLRTLHHAGMKKITITGGEPFLYSGLLDVITFAKKMGFHVTLLTNGMLMSGNAARDVLQQVNKVIISLDSLTDSKRIGIDGQEVFTNILNASSVFPEKIIVRSVTSRGSENEVAQLGEVLHDHGIEHTQTICLPCNLDEINSIPDYDTYDLLSESSFDACGAACGIIALDPEGNVYPCQTLMKSELIITNIFDKDWIDKFHDSNICDDINQFNPYAETECQACDALHFCSGGCRSIAYDVYKDFNKRNDFLCDYYRKSVFRKIKEEH